MTGVQCVHCGELHPSTATFCPATGRPMRIAAPQPAAGYGPPPPAYQPPPQPQPSPYGQAPAAYGQAPAAYGQAPAAYGQAPAAYGQPPPAYGQPPLQGQMPHGAPGAYGPPGGYAQQGPYRPQPGPGAPYAPQGYPLAPARPWTGAGKPIGVLLTEAFQLYRQNIVALLVTAAVLMVPLSLVKSVALTAMLAPTVATGMAVRNNAELARQTAEQMQRDIQSASQDPKKWQANAEEQRKKLEELSRNVASTQKAAVGGAMVWFLGFLAMIVGIAVIYGIAIPLVTGALTIVVADRATGGHVGPVEAYRLLLKRLGKFLAAWIPAFFLILVGICMLVIPGLIVAFLFTFVAPVVFLEDVGGIAALKRSVALVKANVPQVAIMCLVFAAVRIVASIVTHILIPTSWFFFDSFLQDALLLALLPLPIIGTVLLYLDVRKQADGFDDQAVRAGIEGLRRE